MPKQMQAIEAAFPQPLYARIISAIQQHPDPHELADLFHELARVVPAPTPKGADASHHSKKRKLDDDGEVAGEHVSFEIKDVSFQIPARKKLKLQFVVQEQDSRKAELRLQNQQTGAIEHTLPGDQIDQAFCLPVPEKQQRQWNFVLFPKPGATNPEGIPYEQVVFTMSEMPPVGASSLSHQILESDTFVTVTERELNRILSLHGKRVVIPDAVEFASSIPQSHRKGEKAYHVKAHRGSKEGYLFFLDNGIVFGYKKPLAFFPFSSIDSVSYTSVLQRTFNLVIAARDSEDADAKEVEFSMLDQADFAGIDDYIKRHSLNDASMAADRRAKAYNVNKDKKAAEANGDAGAGDAEDGTELQKAEQQLQDEEDEEEEDYEASGGESDGEGEYSDDDAEDEYGDAGDEEGAEEVEHEEDVHDE
ncbi:hypothetical protein LTR36_005219 [Oleoguttula mirabilis]|uniref:Histone chaperone RTT106/FACT complex subunit SPT16-like middle domain-containing protein n=1 Tax=Oleoguttula mirabilis TaxID=1507867 RepID=A0AAV9JXW4_9PEZI|nr:hypothetical protein LTR36_005219 [Oleoguttula mirabilis]